VLRKVGNTSVMSYQNTFRSTNLQIATSGSHF